MSIGQVYQVKIRARLHGQELNNVWHFQNQTFDMQEPSIAQELLANLIPYLRAITALDQQFFSIVVRVKDLLNYSPYELVTGNLNGSYPGYSMPSQLAVVVAMRSEYTGRSKRGRVYLGGVPLNFIDGSSLTPSATNHFLTMCGNIRQRYIDNSATSGLRLGIWSRLLGEPGSSGFDRDAGFEEATALIPRPILGTQRRRRVGVGI